MSLERIVGPQGPSVDFFVPERRAQLSHPCQRFTFFSDLHGAPDKTIARLRAIKEDTPLPSAVIFSGDVTGTPELVELQGSFYNGIKNPARRAMQENSDITDTELLNYRDVNAPLGLSVIEGFIRLRLREMALRGSLVQELTDEKVQERTGLFEEMTYEPVIEEIRRYVYEDAHYSDAAYLHPDAVKVLVDGLRENAVKLAEPMKELQQMGINVVIVEGNWDKTPPIGRSGEIVFSAEEFYREQGIPYVTSMEVLQTETAAIVLLPFGQLVQYADMDIDAIRESAAEKLAEVQDARIKGKQIIVVQHGELMGEPHNLFHPVGEHAQVISGSIKINTLILPDEIIYGHIHRPLIDETGKELDINTKYSVNLGEGKETVVTYMPFGSEARVSIPEEGDRSIGAREPARVA